MEEERNLEARLVAARKEWGTCSGSFPDSEPEADADGFAEREMLADSTSGPETVKSDGPKPLSKGKLALVASILFF